MNLFQQLPFNLKKLIKKIIEVKCVVEFEGKNTLTRRIRPCIVGGDQVVSGRLFVVILEGTNI